MVLARGTAATAPRLQPEGQQLSILRPATPQPPHLCPRLRVPQRGPAFRRQSWNSEDASVEARAAWFLERSGVGERRKVPSVLPSGAGKLKDLHVHPEMTSQERRQGYIGWHHKPVYHSRV